MLDVGDGVAVNTGGDEDDEDGDDDGDDDGAVQTGGDD
jgi:hypothetical protein